MAVMNIDQFVEIILKSRLMDRPAVEIALEGFQQAKKSDDTSAKEFALFLISKGQLTRYQAKRLLAGHFGGFILGGCRVLDRIGEGGMGVVYLAEQIRLHRKVALKVLPFRTIDDDATKRFYREARAAAKLKHPNIVQVFDVDREGDTHFITMEYVNGKNLHEIIKARGAIPFVESLNLIQQTAEGLQHAHENGVIHRDIKPSNLVLEGNVVKILDLGLARQKSDEQITGDQSVLGTLDYMSPEQFEDSAGVDQRSDLYSLGCTWYHMLVGEAPFASRPASGKMLGHVSGQLPCVSNTLPNLSSATIEIMARLMARDRNDRFPDAASFLKELKEIRAYVNDATLVGTEVVEGPPRNTVATTPQTNPQAKESTSSDSDLELEGRPSDHRTLIHTPRETPVISLTFLVPVMAALVLGGVYIGVNLLSGRFSDDNTIVIDIPAKQSGTNAADSGRVAADPKPSALPLDLIPATPNPTSNPPTVSPESLPADVATASTLGPAPALQGVDGAVDPVDSAPAMVTTPSSETAPTAVLPGDLEAASPETDRPSRVPHEIVVREFNAGWENDLESGDVLTLVSADVYELSTPVHTVKSVTLQGTETQRALLKLDVSTNGSFWHQEDSSLTLRHLDIYIDATDKLPGTMEIFKLINSEIHLSDVSITLMAPVSAAWEELCLFRMTGSRPWDPTSGGEPPLPLMATCENVFSRGPGTIFRTSSTQSRLSFSNVIVTGTGPLVHAYNSEARQFAHQRLDIRVVSSTIDSQQPILIVDCRPFDLRPVPISLDVESSVVATLSSVPAEPPLCFWSSPTDSSAIADAMSFAGSGNAYIRRQNALMAKFNDSEVRTLVQVPTDWARQNLGEDVSSHFVKGKFEIISEPWENRNPRDYDIAAPLRKATTQQTFEISPGARIRETKTPRRLPTK